MSRFQHGRKRPTDPKINVGQRRDRRLGPLSGGENGDDGRRFFHAVETAPIFR